jgi:hypothetical protein
MLGNTKNIIFSMLLFSVLSCSSDISAQQPQIIARLNAQKLGIHYAETDRALLYSVLDSNEVVLAADKTLWFVKNNKVRNKILSPVHIFAFDITKHGNGVIVSNDGLFRIKNLLIEPNPIKSTLENPKEGRNIWTVDMINDSIARFVVTSINALFYININKLEGNNYIIKDNEASHFISDVSPTYVGEYKGKHYTLEYDLKEKSECLVIRSDLKTRIPDKIIKFGNLGQMADEAVPIRYDEETNFFYEMWLKDNEMVLYKFDIRKYE